jgi:DNA-binding NarL/FixJ family response regulator
MALLVPSSALIVDDESYVRAYVKLLLRPFEIETIYEASDVPQARELWAKHRPGLVLLDVNMPGESGLVLVRELREQDPEAYIVMLSTQSQAANVKEAADAGADGFIRKDLPRLRIIDELKTIFEVPDADA